MEERLFLARALERNDGTGIRGHIEGHVRGERALHVVAAAPGLIHAAFAPRLSQNHVPAQAEERLGTASLNDFRFLLDAAARQAQARLELDALQLGVHGGQHQRVAVQAAIDDLVAVPVASGLLLLGGPIIEIEEPFDHHLAVCTPRRR